MKGCRLPCCSTHGGAPPARLAPPPRAHSWGGCSFHGQARDLIRKLLTADRTKRIGNLKNGAEDIKKHKWYRGLNWAALYNKQMAATIVPDTNSPDDTGQYDRYADSVEESGPLLNVSKDQELFGQF